MRSIALVLLTMVTPSFAGQAEFDRDSEKARSDHAYVVKLCRKKPLLEIQKCIADANKDLAEALRGLRKFHLGQD